MAALAEIALGLRPGDTGIRSPCAFPKRINEKMKYYLIVLFANFIAIKDERRTNERQSDTVSKQNTVRIAIKKIGQSSRNAKTLFLKKLIC